MKKKEFEKIIYRAMDLIESNIELYACEAIFQKTPSHYFVSKDFWHNIFKDCPDSTTFGGQYKLVFGKYANDKELKEIRLNALAMYLAQSLAFETYKDVEQRY